MNFSPLKMLLLATCLCIVRTASGDAIRSEKLSFNTVTVVNGLKAPWGMAALPDNSMLITERNGTLRLLQADGRLHPDPIDGVPKVAANGQGGLLDVALHPEYATNGWIYLSYSSPAAAGEPGSGANTALMRGKVINHKLVQQELLFKALPNYRAGQHYGSRIAFDNNNYVYLSVGDRGGRDEVQSLENYRGKIFRLHDDGKIPNDNPFVNTVGAATETWSWGHRNPQGMAKHPVTGDIWSHEHGPKGGDELNRILVGQNYGWPAVTYGVNYSGSTITNETERPDVVSPITFWVPSIAPSGMAFVNSPLYPEWQNNILIGSLKFQRLHRLEMSENNVTHEEILLEGIGRLRAIEQGTDGHIYIAVESGGKIIRLEPKSQ